MEEPTYGNVIAEEEQAVSLNVPSIPDAKLEEMIQATSPEVQEELRKPEQSLGNNKTEAYWKGYADGGEAERDIQKKMMKRYAAVFFVSFVIAITGLLLAIKFKVV